MPLDRGGFNADGAASYREMVGLAFIKDYFVVAHITLTHYLKKQIDELTAEVDEDPE